jgi:HEAT repeat protein
MNKQKRYTPQPSTVEQSLNLLKQKKIPDRVKALEALAQIDDPQVVHRLIEALADRSPAIRSAAANHLGSIKKRRLFLLYNNMLARVRRRPTAMTR